METRTRAGIICPYCGYKWNDVEYCPSVRDQGNIVTCVIGHDGDFGCGRKFLVCVNLDLVPYTTSKISMVNPEPKENE